MKVGRFLSKYLKAADVKKPQVVTIEAAELETVGKEEEEKLILYFDELEQGVVPGKQVLSFFAEEFGEESDEWIGEKVEIYNDRNVSYKGKRVGGIRFRLVEKEGGSDV